MLPTLVIVATLFAPGDRCDTHLQNPKAVPLLKTWIKQYRSGKIDLGDIDKKITSKSAAKKAGLISPEDLKKWEDHVNQRRELGALIDGAVKVNTEKAAEVLLDVAAVGLDPEGKYTAAMAPWYVRWKVRQELKKLSDPEARNYLLAAAKGSPKGPKKLRLALQAAALSVLGTFGDASYVPVMEGGLKHESPLVRAFAAEGLAAQADPRSLPAVVDAISQEKDELARNRLFHAFFQVYQANRGANREVVARCQKIAADLIGKGSWRSDMLAIDFARFARSKEAVPMLIELLARFVEHPEEVAAGKLTGRQRTFAYEILTDITGAYYPIDDAKAWRDYWKRSKETFQVANNRKTEERRKTEFAESEKNRRAALGDSGPVEAAADRPQPTVGMSTGKVFGTTIQGSRILFIADVSNTAMEGAYLVDASRLPAELKGEKRILRIDVMKAVLHHAIEGLTTDTCFNIVAAAGGKPRMWQKKGPVPATAANKKSAQKFLKSLGGSGGSGMWSNPYDSIEIGLGIENQAWGQVGTHGIDEVFMLSVRRAELGKLQHPEDIVVTMNGICELAKVRFNTAYLGPENDEHDQQGLGKHLMEELAKATGGKFIRP